MTDGNTVLITFMALLAGGMLAALSVPRMEWIAWRFVRLVGVLVFAIVAAVTVWRILGPSEIQRRTDILPMVLLGACGLAGMILLTAAPFLEKNPNAGRWVSLIGGLAGVAAGCAWEWNRLAGQETTWFMTAGFLLNRGSEAALLGAITVAWLLGHAYLTATKMTMAPLRSLSRWLMITFIVRGFLVVAAAAWGAASGDWDLARFLANPFNGLILFIRVGVGLIGLGIFATMVLDCVKRRSTQSATGILYFASIFAYLGELSGQYLTLQTGLPV